MGTSTVTFDVRGGEDYATFTTQSGDTTSTKVSSLKGDPAAGRESRPEWAIAGPAYDAWKADAKAQKEAKAADEAKAKDAPQATAEPAPAPEDNGDDDDDKNGKAGTRRTLAKGYRK